MLDQTTPKNDAWAAEHIARSQTCPQCLGPVTGHNTRKAGRVMAAEYECAMLHRWNLTWVLPKVAA